MFPEYNIACTTLKQELAGMAIFLLVKPYCSKDKTIDNVPLPVRQA